MSDGLSTDRLLLRPVRVDDADDIFAGYARDAEVTRYLRWRPEHSVDSVRAFLQHAVSEHKGQTVLSWAITELGQDCAIGMITLRRETSFKGELGFVLARPFWGRGYMPEAARCVIALALGPLELHRVSAYCDYQNERSARVLAKSGMSYEGLLRRFQLHPNLSSEPRDALLFAAYR